MSLPEPPHAQALFETRLEWISMRSFVMAIVLCWTMAPAFVVCRALISEDAGRTWKPWGPDSSVATVARSEAGVLYAATYSGRLFRQDPLTKKWKTVFGKGRQDDGYDAPDVVLPLPGKPERIVYGSYAGSSRTGFWILDVEKASLRHLIDGAALRARLIDNGHGVLADTWSDRYLIDLTTGTVESRDRGACVNPNLPLEQFQIVHFARRSIDPPRIELQTSHDGGKTVAESRPITLPGLSSEDNLQPCEIPRWDTSTMYAVGPGPSGAAGFYLSRNSGQTWSWRGVDPEQRRRQSVRLYVHPSIPGKAYLLSSQPGVVYVIEDFDRVRQTITNVGLMKGEELQDLYIDPIDPERLFLIAVPFHDR
jgi:hypothetical protein